MGTGQDFPNNQPGIGTQYLPHAGPTGNHPVGASGPLGFTGPTGHTGSTGPTGLTHSAGGFYYFFDDLEEHVERVYDELRGTGGTGHTGMFPLFKSNQPH
jgi:hypothetical protein